MQIHHLLPAIATSVVGAKRQHVGSLRPGDASPDEFKAVWICLFMAWGEYNELIKCCIIFAGLACGGMV